MYYKNFSWFRGGNPRVLGGRVVSPPIQGGLKLYTIKTIYLNPHTFYA